MRISSLEIAELTGKEHKNVLADIRKILDEAGISTAEFSAVRKNSQNKDMPCFNPSRRECDLVVSGYSVKYRLAIIDRWHDLESKQQLQIPQTLSEALLLAGRLAAEKEQAIAKIEAAQFCAPCKLPSGQTAQAYRLPRRECDFVISNICRLAQI
ncbi:Rha family transcriptional regulator [Methylomonas sp. UP202]|uniref:Rha family transcriptional regulator n=1 Tax=Methylomonas sp. UP202 TaxID=3040943 RepID=UPI002479D899|nr:Rha family transcriptional regulator [Methylomonas sp. UP202]WGS85032.1 Rha family transcriptional regulator [Methylomonas sp. UP202]